ncbi:MAG TPA: hypothetical protein VHY35_01690 [Stellaceae bacterium]|jgi:hypothetical protein|nr:hypothetical protein [Stellaceae bacterium]
MSDDPFALGGRPPSDDAIIVDREAEAFLPYLDTEPVLGPMARELFVVEEAQGNLVGGPLGQPEAWAELAERFRAVFPAVCSLPAETLGGLIWRLGQIKTSIADCEVPEYLISLVQAALDDALRLANR